MASYYKNDVYKKNRKMKVNNKFNYFTHPLSVTIPKFPIPNDLKLVVQKNFQPFSNMTEKSEQFLKVLDKIKKEKGLLTKESNHLQILKIMLYLEEIQNNLDMRIYDQNCKTIERTSKESKYFKIHVDNLMEVRPSVRPNDTVEIRDSETKILFLLRVIDVMDTYIIAIAKKSFQEQYDSKKNYNIRFQFQNYPLRCCHYAISLINLYELTPHFFPTKRPTYNNQSIGEYWYNKMIEDNPQQKQAVLNITKKSSFPAPYILYGPPGTGKTATLVEAICQIWQNNSSENVLVCTPSNVAADVITKRLLKYIPKNHLYRIYSPSKEGSTIDEDIINCSNCVDGQIIMLPKEFVVSKNIVITTLCASTRLLFLRLREKHFSYIFIDEAGQATEPDSMIPFSLLSSIKEGRIGRLHGQIIISGDHQQLGPCLRSKLAQFVLGKSMLERLIECEPYKKNEHGQYNPSYITKLVRNYRSHPMIIHVPNKLFYDNELIACGNENINKAEDWKYLAKPKFPIMFHGVIGNEIKAITPSSFNKEEIEVVLNYVKRLVGQKLKNNTITQDDIGIVTPFCAQSKQICEALQQKNYNKIEVGTVELFQGREKDIIIVSTVRSKVFCHDKNVHIGFLSNPKRFNVALTRAKALLIVIGNPTILQIDEYWSYFLKFCKINNACKGVNFNIDDGIEERFKKLYINSKLSTSLSILNDSKLEIINMDDGIIASSDSSVIDEYEHPHLCIGNAQANYSKHEINKSKQSGPLLSDVIIVKTASDLKLEKKAAKKQSKNNRKKKKDDKYLCL